jgi:predicted transcriptional regulator
MWWFKRQNGSAGSAPERLGSLESEVMERLWFLGEASVRDLHGEFAPRLAYTTIMTTLDRLYKKGLLTRRKAGKAYMYVAAFDQMQYRERLAQHWIGMALRHGSHSHAVLSSFVDAVSRRDQQMLDRLDRLVKAKRRALRREEPGSPNRAGVARVGVKEPKP